MQSHNVTWQCISGWTTPNISTNFSEDRKQEFCECSDTKSRMSLRCSSEMSCAVLVPENFIITLRILSMHVKSDHYRPASKTPSERRFASGPIVTRDWKLTEHIICRGRPLNSFAVSRAKNSIDPDQTEPTLFAKIISKMFQQRC